MKSQWGGPPHSIDSPKTSASIQSAWMEVRTHLENLKKDIYNKIQSYPAPIPACDQQFNYLLEERTKVSLEIRKLNQVSHEDHIGPIQEFIKNSPLINDQLEKKITGYLKEVIAKQEN